MNIGPVAVFEISVSETKQNSENSMNGLHYLLWSQVRYVTHEFTVNIILSELEAIKQS